MGFRFGFDDVTFFFFFFFFFFRQVNYDDCYLQSMIQWTVQCQHFPSCYRRKYRNDAFDNEYRIDVVNDGI